MKHDHSSFTAQTTAKRAYGTDATARIAQFMPMVRKLAWYYESSCGGSLDVDDLQQAGLIALTELSRQLSEEMGRTAAQISQAQAEGRDLTDAEMADIETARENAVAAWNARAD